MTKTIRITVDVVNLDATGDNFVVDTGFEPAVVTIAYTEDLEDTVYDEATELAYCIERIAAAG